MDPGSARQRPYVDLAGPWEAPRALWRRRSRSAMVAARLRCPLVSAVCGRSAVGSASPCQGEGRGFEPRRPLGEALSCAVRASGVAPDKPSLLVEWPRGEATACKAVYTGSNPVSTSVEPGSRLQHHQAQAPPWAIGAVWLARFLDTEEVTGSSPVSPTSITAGRAPFSERGRESGPATGPERPRSHAAEAQSDDSEGPPGRRLRSEREWHFGARRAPAWWRVVTRDSPRAAARSDRMKA